jgi:molybdenum cofactor cytidylyltransferase
LSSLQTALEEIPSDSEGFLFQPVDCPATDPETIQRIVNALHSSGALLVIPRFEGERGHPVGARRELISEFLALPQEAKAKDVVHRHVDRTHYLDVDDPGILSDIDDPEAYRVLREQSA